MYRPRSGRAQYGVLVAPPGAGPDGTATAEEMRIMGVRRGGRVLRDDLEARDRARAARCARARRRSPTTSASPAALRRGAWRLRRAARSMSSARSATCARIDTRSRQDFGKAAGDERVRLLAALAVPHLARSAAPPAAARGPAGRRSSRLRPAARPRPRLVGDARARASRTRDGGASESPWPTAALARARSLRRSSRPGRTPAPGSRRACRRRSP